MALNLKVHLADLEGPRRKKRKKFLPVKRLPLMETLVAHRRGLFAGSGPSQESSTMMSST